MNVKEHGFLWRFKMALRGLFAARRPGEIYATASHGGLPTKPCCSSPDPKFKHGALYCFRCCAPLE